MVSRLRLLGFFLLVFVACCWCRSNELYRPVVLMHGIHKDSSVMNPWKTFLSKSLPGVYVKNVEIGNGVWDSMFMSMPDQLVLFNEHIVNDTKLRNGFNLVCHSQGGLLCRGYIEMFNEPRVYTFVALNSPLSGVLGVPMKGYDDLVDEYVSDLFYTNSLQEIAAVPGYWKDPLQYEKYLNVSRYLPFLNNEFAVNGTTSRRFNQKFKDNFASLERLVLYFSPVDNLIKPPSSGWFGYYKPGSITDVVPCYEQDFYKGDWFGLRTLVESGRVTFLSGHTRHDASRQPAFYRFYEEHIKQYLQ